MDEDEPVHRFKEGGVTWSDWQARKLMIAAVFWKKGVLTCLVSLLLETILDLLDIELICLPAARVIQVGTHLGRCLVK